MANNDNPCYGCTRRIPGCQDTCPDAAAWKKEYKERRAKIKAARQKEVQVTSTLIERKESIKRKRSK